MQGNRLHYTQLGQVFRHYTLGVVSPQTRRRWRDYRTASGRRPIKEFLDELSDVDAAAIVAAMKDVRDLGLAAARHLRGEIYEVRADGDRQTFRILLAPEGQRGQVLLALAGFSKKTEDAAGEDPARRAAAGRLAAARRASISAMRCRLRYSEAHG